MEPIDLYRKVGIRKARLFRLHRMNGLVPPLIVYALAALFMNGISAFLSLNYYIGGVMLYCLGASAHIYNQMQDWRSDRNARFSVSKLDYVYDEISPFYIRLNLAAMTMLVVASLAIFSSIWLIALIGCGYLAGILYSRPPVRTKGVPFVGIFSNIFGYVVLTTLTAYLAVGGELVVAAAFIALAFAPALAGTIVAEMVDHSVDKGAGDRTTAVFLGMKRSATIVLALTVITAVEYIPFAAYILLHYGNPLPLLFIPVIAIAIRDQLRLRKRPTEELANRVFFNMMSYATFAGAVYLVLRSGIYVIGA